MAVGDLQEKQGKVSEPYKGWPNEKGFQGDRDTRTPTELKVTGNIPPYAAGTLYRTGPGGYQVDGPNGKTLSMSHWFDGFTQIHRFQILPPSSPDAATKVLYNSRTTVDKLLEYIRETGDTSQFSFGQKRDPCQSLFKKVMTVFEAAAGVLRKPAPADKDVANIGVTISTTFPGLSTDREKSDSHGSGINTLWTKTDASSIKELDPETLEPIGITNQRSLHPELTGPMSAAHAKADPVTGDIFNFNLELGLNATYRVFGVSAATGETRILAKISDVEAAYLHSFFLTENYVILCVWNSHIVVGGVKVLFDKNILDSIAPFDRRKKAKWFVIDRRHGRGVVARYESDPFYCFHTVNAWEETSLSDSSKIDIVTEHTSYQNLDILKKFYYDNLRAISPGAHKFLRTKGEAARGELRRWRLPDIMNGGAVQQAQLISSAPSSSTPELPTLNPQMVTRPHRYTYGISDRGLSTLADGIIKYDAQTQKALIWEKFAHTPGESIFVPDPDGKDEDDGVLLSVVLDGKVGLSYLLCLNAKTMEELGKAELETAIGFGFHGTHAPQSGRAIDV
ncbi:MAG: hypothetical protein M1825_004685 [Sarcosagium campestre]|nr:MAG: hypothetical protein M1825_004685 [Sarcosagium campestre]